MPDDYAASTATTGTVSLGGSTMGNIGTGTGFDSLLTYTPTASGTYYLSAGSAVGGTYPISAAMSSAPSLRTITARGDSSNRVDIIFLGDGYTSSEITTTYTSHIQSCLNYIFDDSALTQPFGRYENFFNIYAVDVVSNQSGADDPTAGIVRDTALDASYNFDGYTQRLLYVDSAKTTTVMNDALSGTGIGAEMRYVLVNDTQYGGGGGLFRRLCGR